MTIIHPDHIPKDKIPSFYEEQNNRSCLKRVKKNSKQRFITSYGIILFTVVDTVIYYQICKPRDSVNYVSFIRGLYNNKQINFFLSLMTMDELNMIKKYNFDVLWEDLWHNKPCRMYTAEYKKAKKKFNDNHQIVLNIINTMKTKYNEDHLWGFPKGKRNDNEKYKNAAIREFEEETCISADKIKIVSDIPLIETYHGSNNKLYKTVYFPAMSERILYNDFSYVNNPIRKKRHIVSDEIEKIEWHTYENIMVKFASRPYRQRMFTILHKCILEQLEKMS